MENNSRSGRITASRAAEMMASPRAKKDGLFGETAKSYALELALDRLGIDTSLITGMDVSTWQMDWGNEYEPVARGIYEKSRGISVQLPGFIADENMTGCTPDGIILAPQGDVVDGNLQIKCPQWSNHLKYYMYGIFDYETNTILEKNYWYQIQFEMMVTGAKWCDFMTFHPEFPNNLKAKVHRYTRSAGTIAEFKERIPAFNELITETMQKLM